MSFKILTDDTLKVIHRSNVHFSLEMEKRLSVHGSASENTPLLVLCLKCFDINTHGYVSVLLIELALCMKEKVIWTHSSRRNRRSKNPKKVLFHPKRVLFDFLSSVHLHIKPDTSNIVGKEMPISRIVVAVPNATVVLLD
jgi:hypothetical protein